MSLDVDLWLAYQDIDFRKLCNFLARDPIEYTSQNQTTLIISNLEVYLSQRKGSTYQQMIKYDKYRYWDTYVIIDCLQHYYAPMVFLISLTIAKYVSAKLKGAAFFTDNDGYTRFFMGKKVLFYLMIF